MSLGKGNRNKSQQTITRTTPVVPQFVRQQQQQVFNRANQFQPQVYEGPRVAQPTADQREFFDRTRDYVDRAMDRPQATIDTSALEALQGRTIDTSGIMGMLGQRADTSALQQLRGQRADTSGLEALMGRGNQAASLFDELYNREVTTGLNDAVRFAADDALQNVNNLYANSGRLGSAAFGRAAAEGPPRAIARILLQAAENDRQAQMRAADTLAQIYGADLGRDIGLAQAQLAAEQQGILNDIGISGQLADFSERGLSRDMAAHQSIASLAAQDLARQQSLAQSLAGFDVSQAQLDAARQGQDIGLLQLLERSGAAQQGQRQAEIAAAQQYIADQNAAAQQQYNNQLAAAGLGRDYIGSNTIKTEPGADSGGGGGLLNTLGGLASTYIGLGAPGLELVPVVGPGLKAAAMGAGLIGSLGSIPFSSGREEVLMYGPKFNRAALSQY